MQQRATGQITASVHGAHKQPHEQPGLTLQCVFITSPDLNSTEVQFSSLILRVSNSHD